MDADSTDHWERSNASREEWRGGEHIEGWPEEFAGPEYWAYRTREEIERTVSELVGERTAREQ